MGKQTCGFVLLVGLTVLGSVGCRKPECPAQMKAVDGLCVTPDPMPRPIVDLETPLIDGEVVTGRDKPVWTWSEVPGADYFEVRCVECDQSDWMRPDTLRWEAPTAPQENAVFEVRACVEEGCSETARFGTEVMQFRPYEDYEGPWVGIERALSETSMGRVAVVVSEPMLVTNFDNRNLNLVVIENGLNSMVDGQPDALAFNIGFRDGEVVVADRRGLLDTKSPALSDALEHIEFENSNQLLSLRVLVTDGETFDVAAVVDELGKLRGTFAKNGRPVIVRTDVAHRAALQDLKTALDDAHPFVAPYVWTQLDMPLGAYLSLNEYQASVELAASEGVHGVSFHSQETELLTKVNHARSLDLHVDLNGHDDQDARADVLEHFADVSTCLDVAATRRECLGEVPPMLFFDTSVQTPADGRLAFSRDGGSMAMELGAAEPSFDVGVAGDAMFGPQLGFQASARDRLVFAGTDRMTSQTGYMVSTYVVFDNLDIPAGTNQTIVRKGSWGDFALALDRSRGGDPKIEFTVYLIDYSGPDPVGLSFETFMDVDELVEGQGYWITGIYDGPSIKLTIDQGRLRDVPTGIAPATNDPAHIASNVAEVSVGTQLLNEDSGQESNYFDGKVQMVLVSSLR